MMKLISLNIWGGHVRNKLLEFIKSNDEVDIFCLQEVYCKADKKISTDDKVVILDIFEQIAGILTEHNGYFCPVVNNIYGIAIFIKKNYNVINNGDLTIFQNDNYIGVGPAHSRKLQWLEVKVLDKKYTIVNVHGLWNGLGKNDSPDRIRQSEIIKEFITTQGDNQIILCGDLNIRPDTQSMAILNANMLNAINEFNIISTRSSLYPKEEKFADYLLVDKQIQLSEFCVMDDEVSDHLPLLAKIDIHNE